MHRAKEGGGGRKEEWSIRHFLSDAKSENEQNIASHYADCWN
jgi:hypothetical protein